MSTSNLKWPRAQNWSLENLFFELISLIDQVVKIKNENRTKKNKSSKNR